MMDSTLSTAIEFTPQSEIEEIGEEISSEIQVSGRSLSTTGMITEDEIGAQNLHFSLSREPSSKSDISSAKTTSPKIREEVIFCVPNQNTIDDLSQWYETLNDSLKKVRITEINYAQQPVEELLDQFNDIELFITQVPTNELEKYVPYFISRIDLYYQLFMYALRGTRKRSKVPDATIFEDLPKFFLMHGSKNKLTDFMVFLIKKVLDEKFIMDEVCPILAQHHNVITSSKELITKCISEYVKLSYGEIMVGLKDMQRQVVRYEYITTNQSEKKQSIQNYLEKLAILLVDQFKGIEAVINKMPKSQLQTWKQEQDGIFIMSEIDLYYQMFMLVLRGHHNLWNQDSMIMENLCQYIPIDGSIDFIDFLSMKVLRDQEAIMEEIWSLMSKIDEDKATRTPLELITKLILEFVKKSIKKLNKDLTEKIPILFKTEKIPILFKTEKTLQQAVQQAIQQVEDLLNLFNTIEGSIAKISTHRIQDDKSDILSRLQIYIMLFTCALREKDENNIDNDMQNPSSHFMPNLAKFMQNPSLYFMPNLEDFMVFLVKKVLRETTIMREIWPLLAMNNSDNHDIKMTTPPSIWLITGGIVFFINDFPTKLQTLEDNVLASIQNSATEGAMRQVEELLDSFNAIEVLVTNQNFRLSNDHLLHFVNTIHNTINKVSKNNLSKKLLESWTSFIDEYVKGGIQSNADTNSTTTQKIDVYYQLFVHVLNIELQKITSVKASKDVEANMEHKIAKELLKDNCKVKPTDFMILLVKNILEEEAIMKKIWPFMTNIWPIVIENDKVKKKIWKFQEAKYDLRYLIITKCIHMYERKSLDPISLEITTDLRNGTKLFQNFLKHMKDSGINNRGRVYDYILGKLEDNHKYELHNDFVNLFFKDEEVMQYKDQLTFSWIRQYGYKHLSMCVWEYHQTSKCEPSKFCTKLEDAKFALDSGALIGQRLNNKGNFFDIWCDSTLDVNTTYRGITALHAAAYIGHVDAMTHLLAQQNLDINARTSRTSREKKNKWKLPEMQTALHIAMDLEHWPVVKLLCDNHQNNMHMKKMRFHEEDGNGNTALDIIYKKIREKEKYINDVDKHPGFVILIDFKNILLSKDDVQKGIERSYRDRQVHVDAANAILVGAALIASVAFAGWLQPPLGYTDYYQLELPPPAPPNTYESYPAYDRYKSIQAFALFNSLSFFFAIATVITGADAVFPIGDRNIRDVVKSMRRILGRAIKFLITSILCILGAFSSAGIAILPPHLYFRKHFVLSVLVGSGLCCVMIWKLLSRHSKKVQSLNARLRSIIQSYTNIF